MAKHVFYNASVTVNGVDLSAHVESLELPIALASLAAAGMGELQSYNMAGVQDVGDVKVTFYQDYAASKTYATLFTLWQNRTSVNLVVKADAGATAATNPQFTLSVFVKDMPIMSGSRGDRHMAPVTFSPAGALAVATS